MVPPLPFLLLQNKPDNHQVRRLTMKNFFHQSDSNVSVRTWSFRAPGWFNLSLGQSPDKKKSTKSLSELFADASRR